MKATIRPIRALAFVAAVAGAGLVLRWATAGTIESLSADDFGSLAALVAGGIAWAAYGWLCLAIALTVLERTPGALGRAASTVAGGITSDASRTLLRSALGVAAVTPLAVGTAHAAPAGGGPAHSVHAQWAPVEKASSVPLTSSGTPSTWDPRSGVEPASTVTVDRSGRDQAHRADRTQPRIAIPDRPTTGAETRYTPIQPAKPVQDRPVQDKPWQHQPERHKPAETKPGHSEAEHSRTARPAERAVVAVREGDSLWSIAAAELGPGASDAAIAERWPQWYAANAPVIGSDPDLIQPGQVLHAPADPPS
ncbi:MAG TPA: hypothetical protein VGJ44_05745 [Kribbellaceae bacterium]